MSDRNELFRLIAGRSTTTAVEAILAAGYVKVPQPVKPVPKTFEERIAFEKDWDAKVEAGRQPRVPESCPEHLMDGRNEIRCWRNKGHEGDHR